MVQNFLELLCFHMVIRPLNLRRQKMILRKTKYEKATDVPAWAILTSKDVKKIIFSTIANIV